ncbi:MAG: hypothetical protein NC930_06435, partial [Candidatus Omnitrophica bacterium]|nr:hypothetical protein [Candidatus Omnitrophota bacterium]
MLEWQERKARPWLRTIAFLTALVFTSTTISWADGSNLAASVLRQDKFPADLVSTKFQANHNSSLDSFDLPDSVGQIKKSFQGSRDRIVIHVQDAHVNEEAQLNIAGVLNYFVQKHGLSLVSLEGADGDLYTEMYSFFPNEQARKNVAGYFLKEGRLTGPEYLAIVQHRNLMLYGVEDPQMYEENRKAYLEALDFKAEDEEILAQLGKILKNMARFVFSDTLRELIRRRSEFLEDRRDLAGYVRYLLDTAEARHMAVHDYPGLHSLISLIELEKRIDFERAEKEIENLAGDLKNILSKEKLSRLLNHTVEFQMKKMRRADYYGYLEEEIRRLLLPATVRKDAGKEASLREKYENLLQYLRYMRLYDSIGLEIFDEIENLEKGIKNKLFTTEDEVMLDRLLRIFEIYQKMFEFSLTKQDADFFYTYRDEFSSKTFERFLTPLFAKYRFSDGLPSALEILDRDLGRVERFYSLALKRDRVLIEKAVEKMESSKQTVMAIVTGGFHTPGIEQYLRERDYSYLVIAPRMAKEIDEAKETQLYEDALRQKPVPLEKLLVEAYFQPRSSMLNDPRFQLVAPHLVMNRSRVQRYLSRLDGPQREAGIGQEGVRQDVQDVHTGLYLRALTFETIYQIGRFDLAVKQMCDAVDAQIPAADRKAIKSKLIDPYQAGVVVRSQDGNTTKIFVSPNPNAAFFMANAVYNSDAVHTGTVLADLGIRSHGQVRYPDGKMRIFASISKDHLPAEVLEEIEAAHARISVSGDQSLRQRQKVLRDLSIFLSQVRRMRSDVKKIQWRLDELHRRRLVASKLQVAETDRSLNAVRRRLHTFVTRLHVYKIRQSGYARSESRDDEELRDIHHALRQEIDALESEVVGSLNAELEDIGGKIIKQFEMSMDRELKKTKATLDALSKLEKDRHRGRRISKQLQQLNEFFESEKTRMDQSLNSLDFPPDEDDPQIQARQLSQGTTLFGSKAASDSSFVASLRGIRARLLQRRLDIVNRVQDQLMKLLEKISPMPPTQTETVIDQEQVPTPVSEGQGLQAVHPDREALPEGREAVAEQGTVLRSEEQPTSAQLEEAVPPAEKPAPIKVELPKPAPKTIRVISAEDQQKIRAVWNFARQVIQRSAAITISIDLEDLLAIIKALMEARTRLELFGEVAATLQDESKNKKILLDRKHEMLERIDAEVSRLVEIVVDQIRKESAEAEDLRQISRSYKALSPAKTRLVSLYVKEGRPQNPDHPLKKALDQLELILKSPLFLAAKTSCDLYTILIRSGSNLSPAELTLARGHLSKLRQLAVNVPEKGEMIAKAVRAIEEEFPFIQGPIAGSSAEVIGQESKRWWRFGAVGGILGWGAATFSGILRLRQRKAIGVSQEPQKQESAPMITTSETPQTRAEAREGAEELRKLFGEIRKFNERVNVTFFPKEDEVAELRSQYESLKTRIDDLKNRYQRVSQDPKYTKTWKGILHYQDVLRTIDERLNGEVKRL